MTQQDERNLTRNLLKGIYLFRRTAFLVALIYFIGAGFGAIYNPINTPANDFALWFSNLILVKQVTHDTYPIFQFSINFYLFMFFVYAVDLLCFCLEQEALIEYRSWHFHMKYLGFKRRAIDRLKSKSRIYKFSIPALYSFS
ncbi:hypothetical protein KC224_03235 [Cedecea davisae]|uniref:hypothetical protein n=1 Tax=Cedecea davisae TaxID=158484 RepID=UPI001C0EB5BF|nr:hypothetical protein [Cedecea davisae]MBU4685526.1 hypothetical protein [Cedecea davisae]